MSDVHENGSAGCPVGPLAERVRDFDLYSEADPYGLFEEMRADCPVGRSDFGGGVYLATRYADVAQVLRDSSVFSAASGVAFPPVPGRRWIPMYFDPPDHIGYRQPLNFLFAPSRIEAKADEARDRARLYLQRIVDRGEGDLVKDLANPFPCMTFLLHLGAPVEDTDMLVEWKDVLIAAISDEAARERMVAEVGPALNEYFDGLLDSRAAMEDPPDDVLTGLVRAKYHDRPFTREEQLAVCGFFVIAGLDTVTSMLARSMWFLAGHPEHRAQLVEDPSLIPDAVEELIRRFSSVTPARKVLADTELNGVKLREGDWIYTSTPSAGQDEAEFAAPDAVDFHRAVNRHYGFGAGPHRCLGSHLARMEMRVALEAMVEVMPDFSLDPRSEPKFHFGPVYGMEELRVLVGGS